MIPKFLSALWTAIAPSRQFDWLAAKVRTSVSPERRKWGQMKHPLRKAVPNGHFNLFFGLRPAT
jgi:hypothetical protein